MSAPYSTAGALARALKWKADENRATGRTIERVKMIGPHEEKVLATAIACLLGQGYGYAELSTAYNDLLTEHRASSRASGISLSDSLTITEIPASDGDV